MICTCDVTLIEKLLIQTCEYYYYKYCKSNLLLPFFWEIPGTSSPKKTPIDLSD